MSVNTEETLCIPVTLGKVYQEMHLSPVELLRTFALNQIHAHDVPASIEIVSPPARQ